MTSSNENIFRVTGPLCGEITGPGEFPTQRPVTRSFDVFFDLRLNKRLSKQPWGWWFETPSWSLWRQYNEISVAYYTTKSHSLRRPSAPPLTVSGYYIEPRNACKELPHRTEYNLITLFWFPHHCTILVRGYQFWAANYHPENAWKALLHIFSRDVSWLPSELHKF